MAAIKDGSVSMELLVDRAHDLNGSLSRACAGRASWLCLLHALRLILFPKCSVDDVNCGVDSHFITCNDSHPKIDGRDIEHSDDIWINRSHGAHRR